MTALSIHALYSETSYKGILFRTVLRMVVYSQAFAEFIIFILFLLIYLFAKTMLCNIDKVTIEY